MIPSDRQFERRLPSWAAVLLWLVACWACSTLAVAESDLSEPEQAVQAGREALSSSPKIPWYDPETDDFRAAKVQPPPKPRVTSQGSLTFLEFLVVLGWVVLAILLIAIVYMITKKFLYREVQGSIVVERTAVGADIVRVEELPVSLEKAPSDYLDEAQRLYRNGQFERAIIYLFSHQLLQLDRRHWLRLIKGKTNRQYLREIRRHGTAEAEQLSLMFEKTVLLFEEVFFGKRVPDRNNIDEVWREIDQFESLVLVMEQRAA
ncbi:hypothetical protein [Aeoliella mucimassa]|uniref:DUF4129 domain-containing protein n=1 Tax=Aeoliella mucimassa TaxID=2527972 RepID=A0A518AW82_9BACT|nr:hypothetical protein [Aeoliella mucimassa]QDU58999.1 hypothetical protein Pan181_52400 [Aeoliella mucimassa]